MNDNSTPEEIKAFEIQNPGIVAEEKETQPIPQWPIRVGLMLIAFLCFWEWSWFKKATRRLPVVVLLASASAFAQPMSGPIPLSLGRASITPVGCAPVEHAANLTAWWTYDVDGSDVTGNGNNATLHGSPTFAAGKITNAVTFNGSTGYSDATTVFNNPPCP